MNKIISKWEIKKARYLKELWDLYVRKSPVVEWIELEPYMVTINGMEEPYQYNNWKLYIDEKNQKLCAEEIEEHQVLMVSMKEEWKTEEEITEYMKWKWTHYIDRVEHIFECDWLYEKIELFISKL